jgi:hypothetical protein
MALTPVIPDFSEADTMVRLVTDLSARHDDFRRYLALKEGQGATVVRIDEVRKIFGWQYDKPIILPPREDHRPRR